LEGILKRERKWFRTCIYEEVIMKTIWRKPIIAVVMCCLFVSFFIVGCTSSTQGLLGYLKFWGPKNETGQTVQAQNEQTFIPQARTALKGNPDSHYLLGLYLQKQSKHREAIEEFTKTTKIDPMYAKAYNAMGISYDNLGEFAMATKCYEVTLDLSPTGEHYNNLGYNLVLKGEYDEAVEMLKTAVAIDPGNDRIRSNLALAYSIKGGYDAALGEIQKTSDPDGNRLALAQVLLNGGKVLRASEFVTQVSRMDPTFEQKLPEKDQFVIKMARSLKIQEDMKVAEREWERPVATAKVIQKNEKSAKIMKKVSVAAKTPLYPSDFMMNRNLKVVKAATEQQEPKITQDNTVQLVHQLFPARYAAGGNLGDRAPHSIWF
jgi:tetratricopeptide (TPR) repeat protein